MDENKRQRLVEIGYEIHPCCGMCLHGNFREEDDFGTCTAKTYDHLKHSQSRRQLSVLRYGWCRDYEPVLSYENYIHGFKEFLK